jgi:hypothetical protein
MLRRTFACLFVVLGLLAGWSLAAGPKDEVPPLVFELSIDGETFLIETEKQVDLKSKAGKTYKVALRLAQRQRWALNTIRFEYDGAFHVDDDNEADTRTATLTHELGFSLAVIDLGPAPEKAGALKLVQQLADSMVKSYKQGGATDVTLAKPADRKFGELSGQEIRINYVDRNKKMSTTLVSLIVAGKQAGACVLSYPTDREADVLPLAKVTLESMSAK